MRIPTLLIAAFLPSSVPSPASPTGQGTLEPRAITDLSILSPHTTISSRGILEPRTQTSTRGCSSSPSAKNHAARDPFKTIIPSRHSFAKTRWQWEAQLPPINYTYRDLLRSGDVAGGLAALEALPPLSLFVQPPRDFGLLLSIWGEKDRKIVAYEVGNPLVSSRVVRHAESGALYAPWRVLLLEDEVDGKVQFEFDAPTGVWGQYGMRQVDQVAEDFEDTLRAAIMRAAGWAADGSWDA